MIQVAQIGVGYWGPNLLRNLIASKRCRVPMVADLSADRREYVQGLYPAVRVTDKVDDVIDSSEVDAVVIATPVATHFSIAERALRAGKHVFVEKPLARSVQEVNELGRVAAEQHCVAMVGHTFLFNAAVRYVKRLIDAGELGEIRYIYAQRLNLGRIRSDVDALWNLAPHDISIIQYWLDNPEPLSLVRRGVAYIQNGIDDVVFLNILYPNRVMANIHVSWLDPQRSRIMVVVGSKKMVVYDDIAENKIAIYDKGIDQMAVLGDHMDYDNQNFQSFSHRSGDVLLPKVDFKEPLKVQLDHFLDCIEKGVEPITGIDHARRVVQILENAQTYARDEVTRHAVGAAAV